MPGLNHPTGTACAAAVEAWQRDLQARAAAGRFFASGAFFVVSGTVLRA